jgi:hypothetical protein
MFGPGGLTYIRWSIVGNSYCWDTTICIYTPPPKLGFSRGSSFLVYPLWVYTCFLFDIRQKQQGRTDGANHRALRGPVVVVLFVHHAGHQTWVYIKKPSALEGPTLAGGVYLQYISRSPKCDSSEVVQVFVHQMKGALRLAR